MGNKIYRWTIKYIGGLFKYIGGYKWTIQIYRWTMSIYKVRSSGGDTKLFSGPSDELA